jgi:tetratricopeptide (TPR) repeat protein
MKTLFTATIGAWPSRAAAVFGAALLACAGARAFQSDTPVSSPAARTVLEKLEADQLDPGKDPAPFILLSKGEYAAAEAALTPDVDLSYPWLRSYLAGAAAASAGLVEAPASAHFRLFLPKGQEFLADYVTPTLEKVGDHYEKTFAHRPRGKVRVEIYPDKESFSAASTLSLETLERSGAIGICKFHRLMILSPKALPVGYRWLDALSHEDTHLMVNELTSSKAELWLHEGTARYFETSYRLDPPIYLTPSQRNALLEAREKGTLIPFRRMSPSMVYLKNQEEVALAFAQVSHAVDFMIREKKLAGFRKFLETLRKSTFPQAFQAVYGLTPEGFETAWKEALNKETWQKSRGAMSDEVRFDALREEDVVGASAEGRLRLGDRMRERGQMEAALIEYDKALADEPDNAIILLKCARARLALDRKDEARTMLRLAVLKNPNYATPMIELAGLVEDKEAADLLLDANAINPFDPRIHRLLGEIDARLGRPEAAREGEIGASLAR